MNRFPKISIVTPNYNGAAFLEETIISIVSQNYPNLEYIIIDGGSTDGSVEIIKKHEKHLAYWISEPDSGMYEAIQKGFERSTGEIMTWLNSDDMYHQKALFTVAEIFIELTEVAWFSGYNTNYDEQGRTLFLRESYHHSRYDMFLNTNRHIQQESTFWRRSLWETAGAKLDTALHYAGDFELWVRFFRYAKLYRSDVLIGGFRVRNGQLTHLFKDKYNEECQKVLQKELSFCSYYDHCIMDEIKHLRAKVLTTTKNVQVLDQIETDIKQKLDFTEKITFDFRNNRFINGDKIDKREIEHIMYKKHENLADFLNYVKKHHKFYPEVVIDVGVANGTFEIYDTFPKSDILLVEPLEEFADDLVKIQKKYELVHVFNCAAGSTNGTIGINVHDDLTGSSLYNEQEGGLTDGTDRIIDVKQLDEIGRDYLNGSKTVFLKIDVQGAELDVLNGAKKLLQNIELIILEVSLHKFFVNGPEFYDVIRYMDQLEYVAYDIFGFLYRPIDGALAQVDMAFVKKDGIFRQTNFFATREQREALKIFDVRNDKKKTDNDKIAFQVKYNSIFEQIDLLKSQQEKYVIYGHGTIGKTIYALMPDSVSAFVDRKTDLISKEIVKGEVYSPNNLSDMHFDKIIISVLGREEEIKRYLMQELCIDEHKIVSI